MNFGFLITFVQLPFSLSHYPAFQANFLNIGHDEETLQKSLN